MMQDAIENGRGEGGVVVEDGRPLLKDLVGRQYDGAPFVSFADDLEEQVRPALVDWQIAQLVHDQQIRPGVLAQLTDEAAGVVGGRELIDAVDGGGKADVMALIARLPLTDAEKAEAMRRLLAGMKVAE